MGSHSVNTQTAPGGYVVNRIATIEPIYKQKSENFVVILKYRAVLLGSNHEVDIRWAVRCI